MSATKQYIWDQAEALANEFGLRTDNVADEIFAYLEKGYPTDEAIATVRLNIATAPMRRYIFKECGVPLNEPSAPTAEKIWRSIRGQTLQEPSDEIRLSVQGGK